MRDKARRRAWVRLTPRRVEILQGWLAALKANIESGDGDFWTSLDLDKDTEDIEAAMQWLEDLVHSKASQFRTTAGVGSEE